MGQKTIFIYIVNGHVITPGGIKKNGSVQVRDGIIIGVSDQIEEMPGAVMPDAGPDRYNSPGFIDIHVHGAGGYLFMDNTVEAFRDIVKTHARYGTAERLYFRRHSRDPQKILSER